MATHRQKFVPMRVVVKKGSRAARALARSAGVSPAALAPGLEPSPQQDLVYRGGKTIPDLKFMNVYVAGLAAWDAGDASNIDRSLAAAMSDANLNHVMMQYFQNRPITTTFLGSTKLPGEAPAVVSQGDAEALVTRVLEAGALDAADLGSTVVNLLLPPGTILTTDERPSTGRSSRPSPAGTGPASSVDGLAGYHGSVHPAVNGAARTVYYAIGVYSETMPNGDVNGIPAFPVAWKNVVATFYHELNEARTDPDVEDAIRTGRDGLLGWTSKQGEECGDFPIDETDGDLALVFQEVPLAAGDGVVPVQLQYSNAVHGPEGPIAKPHEP